MFEETEQSLFSIKFKNWFGNWQKNPHKASKIIDCETQKPLIVYHGTNKKFESFNRDKIKTELNKKFQGNAFYFTSEKDIAIQYAKANRNQHFEKEVIISEAKDLFPPLLYEFFITIINVGGKEGWDLFDKNSEAFFKIEEDYGELYNLNNIAYICEWVMDSKFAIEERSRDIERYMESKYFADIFNNRISVPTHIIDNLRKMHFKKSILQPMVISAYLNIRNLLITTEPEEAKKARKMRYDGFIYEGENTIDDELEIGVFDKNNILIINTEKIKEE